MSKRVTEFLTLSADILTSVTKKETFASNPATARQFDGVMRICPLGKTEMYAAEQRFGVIMLETEAQEACNLSDQRGNKPDKFGLGHAK
ncbi:hypothetical protein T09_8005 [Trichinella sp. T9]|nr:hypothetical protein T09_8005 [Trichinella sp. T9]